MPSSSPPFLSIIVAWCNRPELLETLRHNARHFAGRFVEVIVVNCGGNSAELKKIIGDVSGLRICQVDVPAKVFNKSLALNIGASMAQGSVMLTLDADICIGAGFLEKAIRCTQGKCFLAVNGVVESTPDTHAPGSDGGFLRGIIHESVSEFIWKDGTKTSVVLAHFDTRSGTRSGPGLTFVRRSDFLEVGGLCSDFIGWGWEDIDLHLRLQRCLGLRPVFLEDVVMHIKHGNEKRNLIGRSLSKDNDANFALACAKYNAGDFCGTYHTDVELWQTSGKMKKWTSHSLE
jgi:hypothetical protein